MIDDPIGKDQNAHQRPVFFLAWHVDANGNVPARKIDKYLLQSIDNNRVKHLQILRFDPNEVQAPVVVDDPVIRPAAIILLSEGIENLGGFVVQALPDALMRVLEVFVLAHEIIPCRYEAETRRSILIERL